METAPILESQERDSAETDKEKIMKPFNGSKAVSCLNQNLKNITIFHKAKHLISTNTRQKKIS